MSTILFWSLFGYLCGSIPFAVLIGRLIVKVDPRTVGDGNPGSTNVWIAGGWKIGLTTVALEILKGFIPVHLAQRAGVSEWALIPVGFAPILGHATQPFLGWHGGKALGATGGVWLAFAGLWAVFVFAAGALPVLALQTVHAYASLAGMLALTAFVYWWFGVDWLTAFALLNTVLIFWTHRRDLGQPWRWRAWVSYFLPWRSV
ncbi:MAG TPA: glycerol-3-phosphate acyltransferase [Anaerolineales bacterium]|nr:glycerol-3-phosphate acyltransferase [Anaerolineales bacterium]